MKLTDANKKHNRRFHELPEDQRINFLLKAYSEVFATDDSQKGEFTPIPLSPETIKKQDGKKRESALEDAVNNLNFLMTRFNMLGDPQYEKHIRELALLRFEYMFLIDSDCEITQDPKLVADFFQKRGRPELIKPALERMGENAIKYEFLAKKIIDSPIFEQYIGAKTTTTDKFRTRLHDLIDESDYSKEQTAAALMNEGFDLIACNFNKWYAAEKDFDLRLGKKQYKEPLKEAKWLSDFIAQRKEPKTIEEKVAEQKTNEALLITEDKDNEDKDDTNDCEDHDDDDDEEPSEEYHCSKKEIEALDQSIKYTISKQGDKTEYWVRELAALTSDHAQLKLDSANLVEAKMWDNVWGGQFKEVLYQLKGANPQGKTRNGLNYNRWALLHEQHRDRISPVLAQDSYAMIIAGDILVGNLSVAIENSKMEELQRFYNPDKVKAAVNLAWELMQHPGESDDPDDYEPPRGYLFHVAKEFAAFLGNAPSAAPYIRLANATSKTKLSKKGEQILQSIKSFDDVEKIYTQLGRANQIKSRFLDIFDEIFDKDAEFLLIESEVRGTVATIQDPMFRKYVDDQVIGERLYAAVQRTLQRKNEYNSEKEEEARGAKKLVLTLYQNSVLHPYLEGRVDIGAMITGMIDDEVCGRVDLLTRPFSLKHQGELVRGQDQVIEAYMLADKYRDAVNPEKMQSLVAYLLALNSEMTVHNCVGLTSKVISVIGRQADPNYQEPEYFPDERLELEEKRMAFLSNLYEREKKLGGLDPKKASIGVTNVIFRGNFVQPGRFYPRVDSMMQFLDSPVAELLPTEGLGHDAIKEYRILRDFLRS